MRQKYIYFLVLLFSIIFEDTYAQVSQDATTTFSPLRWTESSEFHEKAALYQVKLTTYFTYVTIKLVPTKNKKRQRVWTSYSTYVVSGQAKLPLLGLLKGDTFVNCSYNAGLGWDNAKKDQEFYYTLVFSGRIPEGQTTFSLVDEATNGRGYGFSNYTIRNPKTNYSIWDENYCKNFADQNNDGLCGIYEEIGGNNYRLACIKYNGDYVLVYLGSGDKLTWWFPGDIKAVLESSVSNGVFKAKFYIIQNKTSSKNAYAIFDGYSMKIYTPDGIPSESTYMKMYPSSNNNSVGTNPSSNNSTMWSGTGFALLNNYVVTNYHVVEEAKSISIQGVNGDFNKKYSADVVASDKFNDLALLKINGVTISNIPYSVKTSMSEVGEDVFVLGYPLTSTMGDEIKLTTGVISSKTGFQGDVSLYQISAPIQPGNSGGPLFDSKGNIIGIVSSKHRGAENVGYAIKTSYLRNLMESFLSTNILPQNNRISTLNLSGKVATAKQYIYYITCSNSVDSNSSFNQLSGNDKVYNNPIIGNSLSQKLKLNSVTVKDNETLLSFSVTSDMAREWICIEKTAYIRANGNKFFLTRADNITYSPTHTVFSYAGQTISFVLHFPPIPKNLTSIDFIEEDNSSDWKLYGIQLR